MRETRWRSGAGWAGLAAVCAAVISAAAPAQAAAPDPAQDPRVCTPAARPSDSGPFSWPSMVFFDSHNATLNAEAKHRLDEFASRVIALHADGLVLEAHTDKAETTKADNALGRQRADAVILYLVKAGVRETPAVTLAGSKWGLVPTAPGVAEPQNRYVMITVRGNFDDYTHQAHRILLCRRWTLANCIGPGKSAPVGQCKAAIDFLVRGDRVERDLDWRTDFVP